MNIREGSSSVFREMQIQKPQWNIPLIAIDYYTCWLKWYYSLGEWSGLSLKVKLTPIIWSNHPTPRHLSKTNESICPLEDLHTNVHSSIICPSVGNKILSIPMVEHYSAIKKNKSLIWTTYLKMNLKISERKKKQVKEARPKRKGYIVWFHL